MKRRNFLVSATASTIASAVEPSFIEAAQTSPQTPHLFAPDDNGKKRPEVAMVIYPGLTLMDLIGPQAALSGSMNVHLVWKNTDLLYSDTGIGIKPTSTFADCPKDLDALFIGGGPGQLRLCRMPRRSTS